MDVDATAGRRSHEKARVPGVEAYCDRRAARESCDACELRVAQSPDDGVRGCRVRLATVHRALETLRAAMNWGMAQTPPLFKKSPFHRFGVRMNKKLETSRDRRLSREEEKQLLDAALQKMNTPEHQFVGPLLHDRIIGAAELCRRRGELLLRSEER